jgi:hypothetical protein
MFDMQRGTAWVDQRENVRGRTHTSSSSFEVNLKTLICFIFVTGALFIHAAAGAQPTAPPPVAAQVTPTPAQSRSRPVETEPPAKPAGTALPAGGSASTGIIRFRPFSVRDPQLNNREALRLLVPADWRVEGGHTLAA